VGTSRVGGYVQNAYERVVSLRSKRKEESSERNPK
jgi:hypothetical protein